VSVVAMAIGVGPAQAALECGDTITSDKTLRSDLECPLDTNGLRIDGNGVTLDMNGHTISAAPQADFSALQVETSVNVKVVDGKLRGFNIGLNVANSEDVTAKGLDIRKAEGRGVYVIGANHVRLQNGAVRGPSVTGIDIRDTTDHIKITGNELRGVGIDVQGGNQKVADNEMIAPDQPGVSVTGGSGSEVEHNRISEVTGGGGIVIGAGVSGVRVDNNSVDGAEFGGILANPGAGPATIVHNEVQGVNFNGFFVSSTADVVLRDNLAKGSNNGDGIHVEDNDTLIEDNRVINNDQHGIESSSANGSGNIARRNGITPQCMPESLCE
jgi:parallel beta-helix repeat protein